MAGQRIRSTLSKEAARRRYVELAEVAVLEQIRDDAMALDRESIPVGPFARLDANVVAAREGKTRGSITNLFGSQGSFQAETMEQVLSARDWIERIDYPTPADHATADAWIDALLLAESRRGPQHGTEPSSTYAFLWAIWLSAVPYGLWSERIRQPSMDEHTQWVDRLEVVLGDAIDHFHLRTADGTVRDLAEAFASLIEGVWLNQCLSTHHPSEPSEPISTLMRRAGRLVWRGGTSSRA